MIRPVDDRAATISRPILRDAIAACLHPLLCRFWELMR